MLGSEYRSPASPRGRWLPILRTQLIVLTVTLIFCEFGLRALAVSPFSPVLEPPNPWLRDEHLEFRGDPRYPDHDAQGYRNAHAVSRADIVALGDSHTYGVAVKRHEAWPAVLAARTARVVYSMAHGGYGPIHYERLLSDAFALKPRLIIVGFYLGNDLFDAY